VEESCLKLEVKKRAEEGESAVDPIGLTTYSATSIPTCTPESLLHLQLDVLVDSLLEILRRTAVCALDDDESILT
jgi:hypothetical protein